MDEFTNDIMRQPFQKTPLKKAGRNDPCPCGSGKKYKKCCLNNVQHSLSTNLIFPHPDFKQLHQLQQLYDEQNSLFDHELSDRNSAEAAYDDVVLSCLQDGNSIEESIKAANAKYPDEALQINENNLTDIRDHYEYLDNHLKIKAKFKALNEGNPKLNGNMDAVNFITYEETDDLIVSFSFDENTEFGVAGFMIHRYPKLEFVLEPHEKGPYVTWTDDDEIILVKAVRINLRQVEIETTRTKHLFDLSKISQEDYHGAVRVLLKMNFDNIYNLKIE